MKVLLKIQEFGPVGPDLKPICSDVFITDVERIFHGMSRGFGVRDTIIEQQDGTQHKFARTDILTMNVIL